MPRAVRVEFQGALYHVMCRGDRREAIFLDESDRRLFLETLGQACGRAGFLVHAFVLMSNHYHLLLETPAGNLVAGMRWFQTTYTARFNARHRLVGHLFQGRYKALLIDPQSDGYGRTIAEYIHLNPARAGMVESEEALANGPWSSYRHYASGKGMPPWLRIAMVYGDHGLQSGRSADRRRFREQMAGRVAEELERRTGALAPGEEDPWAAIRRGWILGSEAFRGRVEELITSAVRKKKRESYAAPGMQRHDERHAQSLLERALAALALESAQVRAMKKNDRRKQAIAWLLKSRTAVGNRWICEALRMGDRSNVNRATRHFDLAPDAETRKIRKILHQCPDSD